MKTKLILTGFLLASMLLLSSDRASAQKLDLSRIVLHGSVIADIVTTRNAIAEGAHEGNGFAPKGLGGQIAVSGIYAGAIEAIATLAERDGHPRIGKGGRFAFGAAKIIASAWNYHVGRQQARKWNYINSVLVSEGFHAVPRGSR